MSTSIVDRVRKLLALAAGSGSPAEAALAAERARELIAAHRLAEADLSLAGGESLPEEQVIEQTIDGSHARARTQAWRVQLACCLAPTFGSRVYYYRATTAVHAIGRESDVASLSYVLGYLGLEITRLTEEGWAAVKRAAAGGELPQPARWRNSFRLGAVAIVRERLAAERRASRAPVAPVAPVEGDDTVTATHRPPSAAQAMVLARDVVAQKQIGAIWSTHFGAKGGRKARWTDASSREGYWAGRAAGEKLDLDRRSRGAIEGSKPRLT